MRRHSVLILLLAVAEGAVNEEAQRKLMKKMAWREANPLHCKRGEEGRSWWCGVNDDDTIAIRNEARLQEVAGIVQKKFPDERSADDKATLVAAEAVAEAHRKAVKSNREKEKKSKKDGGKKKVPSEFRCRKDGSSKDIDLLRYICTVSEYSVQAPSSSSGSAPPPSPRKSDDEKCADFREWQAAFAADASETKAEFFAFLATKHEGYGMLEKLKQHSDDAGTGTGKMREAIERKATDLFRKFSREVHPDKLPRPCAADIMEMMQQVSDRAKKLQQCILRPLRCELRLGGEPTHEEL